MNLTSESNMALRSNMSPPTLPSLAAPTPLLSWLPGNRLKLSTIVSVTRSYSVLSNR